MAEMGLTKISYLIWTLESGGWNQSFPKKRTPETIWFPWTLTTRKHYWKSNDHGAVPPGFLESCIFISRAIRDHSLKTPWLDDLWSPFQLSNYNIMAAPSILGRWYLFPWNTAKLTDSLGDGNNDSVTFAINSVNWNNHSGFPAAFRCSLPGICLYSLSEELLQLSSAVTIHVCRIIFFSFREADI